MTPNLCAFDLVFANGLLTHGLDFFDGLSHPPATAQIPASVGAGRLGPAHRAGHLHAQRGVFPTPFLWPLSDLRVDGVSWSDPRIFFSNVLLAALYAWFFFRRKKAA